MDEASEYIPTAQPAQLDEPFVAWNVPAPQFAHAVAPSALW